ncbi:MAG TPA: DUF1761 domain-containing protein [Candidatus Paceibacterota bacterium]|nr:DUF1761 domain-containing protein [Candidatus Paceibacterota bacterium]
MIADINIWAMLAAALLNVLIGALWYSPFLFGKKWMLWLGGARRVNKGGSGLAYGGGLLIALVMSWTLSYFVDYVYARSVFSGAALGFLVWLGFVVTTNFNAVLYEGKPAKIYLLYVAYQFVALTVMGAVLAVWQ